MRSRCVAVISVATICSLAVGCGAKPGDSKKKDGALSYASNGTFTMVLNGDRGVFDPYHSRIFGLEKFAYDSLVNMQSNGKIVSGLAQRWTADAYSASFVLRRDVSCSDGTPLSASQVAADLNYVGNPKNQSPQYGINTPAQPYTATGDDSTGTVKVVVQKPFGFLLNSIGLVPIVCAKGLANPKMLAAGSDGTGPFVLTKVVPGQSYTFAVRKDYRWGPGGVTTKVPGTPAKVVMRIVSNETTAANLLLSGEVNQALVTGADHARLSTRGLRSYGASGPGFGLRFNQRDGHPGTDKRVRQALVQGLDMTQLIKVSTGGAGRAATGLALMEPRVCTGDTVAGQLPKHDVAEAEKLLDQAGWARGANGIREKGGKPLTLTVLYPTESSTYDSAAAELLAQMWKAIGIDVKLVAQNDIGVAKALLQTGAWDAFTLTGYVYLPSAWVSYLSGPFPPKGTNLGGVNKNYDELIAKAQTLTPPEACAYWDQAEHALYRNLDIVPISDRRWTFYLNHATAETAGYEQPIPTSIRVLE